MSDIKPIHIFRAGRQTAMSGESLDFSEADLQATASAYDKTLHEAPIVVGHPKHDAPAYGWISGVSYAEDGLHAAAEQVDAAFAEMFRKGRFKKVSASFYTPASPANPKPGVYYLRHVGVLGAQPPAIKGLQQAEFADDAEGVVELEFGEADDAALWSRFKHWLSAQMASDPSFSETGGDRTDPPSSTPEDTMTTEELEQREAELAKREKQMKAEQASFAEREAKIAQAEAKARKADAAEFVEALVTDGKILPRDQAGLVEFMDSVDAESIVEFGEGSDKVSKPAGQWLRGFLKDLPTAVDYGEAAGANGDDAAHKVAINAPGGYSVDPERAAMHAKALAYAETNGVDYVTAAQAVENQQ